MNAAQIILELARRGVVVSLTDRGTIRCPATIGYAALSAIKAARQTLVELLTPPAPFVAAIADGDTPDFAAIEALHQRRRDTHEPLRCADCALLVSVGCLSKASNIRNPRRDLAVLKNGRAVIEGDRLEHQCSGFYSHEEAAALARCWLETLARRYGWTPESPSEPMAESESRSIARFLAVEAGGETVVTRAEIMARAHLCRRLRTVLLQVAQPAAPAHSEPKQNAA